MLLTCTKYSLTDVYVYVSLVKHVYVASRLLAAYSLIPPGSPSTRFPESLTLNSSNNSGSLTGRLSSLSIQSDRDQNPGTAGGNSDPEDESSVWDSWDEEEEVSWASKMDRENSFAAVLWLLVLILGYFSLLHLEYTGKPQ